MGSSFSWVGRMLMGFLVQAHLCTACAPCTLCPNSTVFSWYPRAADTSLSRLCNMFHKSSSLTNLSLQSRLSMYSQKTTVSSLFFFLCGYPRVYGRSLRRAEIKVHKFFFKNILKRVLRNNSVPHWKKKKEKEEGRSSCTNCISNFSSSLYRLGGAVSFPKVQTKHSSTSKRTLCAVSWLGALCIALCAAVFHHFVETSKNPSVNNPLHIWCILL